MKINKRRRYKGFNKKSKINPIRVFTLILCLSLIVGYGYIELKDNKIFNNNIFGNFNITKNISSKLKDMSFLNIFKVGKNKANEEYVYDDVSDEIDKIKDDKTSETQTQVSSNVQVATIDALTVYTIQVASIGEGQDLATVEDKLKSNKIPYSVVEVDGVKKVQTYSSFDENIARANLDNARKIFDDAFISELDVPVLSLEYTNKYAYINDVSSELNKLIASYKEEAEFWESGKGKDNLKEYNNILTKRLEIIQKVQENAEKIDYADMNIFKENLINYVKSVNNNISKASKDINEDNCYLSQSLLLTSVQGYYSFINSIKAS